MQILRLAA